MVGTQIQFQVHLWTQDVQRLHYHQYVPLHLTMTIYFNKSNIPKYNHDFSGSRSYLSTTTLVNKGPGSGHLSSSTFPSKNSLVSQDSISRLHDRDDVELSKGWRRFIFKFVPFLALANTGLYLAYLGLRIACVILAQKKFNVVYPGAWVFLGVEIIVAIPSQMHNFWTMWALKKRNRPQLRLTSDEVPGVDVFVTCCGEDDEVILDTVRAACDLDYPRDRFRVIVLDDGKAASLEAAVNQLAYVYSNLYYMARTKVKGVPHHFKAGNLNYGLEQLDLLPGGANEFMAALDADMVNKPPFAFTQASENLVWTSFTDATRFLNLHGYEQLCHTWSWTPNLRWLAHLNCSTTHLYPTPWLNP